MGGQQKNFISDIVFFQHQDGMRKKVRRHFLQCRDAVATVGTQTCRKVISNITNAGNSRKAQQERQQQQSPFF
jgi:hypothetical protein